MGKTDLGTEFNAVPEQDGFQVVEWNIRPTAGNANPDAELDNSCGCDCGCGCNLERI